MRTLWAAIILVVVLIFAMILGGDRAVFAAVPLFGLIVLLIGATTDRYF